MAQITVFADILSGNMGEGWQDEVAAAHAYATYLEVVVTTSVEHRYPGATIEVRATVQRASGAAEAFIVAYETREVVA